MQTQTSDLSGKKILIIHFRVGRTDGVSLEIASWKEILERAGAQVALCAGPVSIGADYVIPDLEQQLNPDIYCIDEDAFGGLKHFDCENSLLKAIQKKESILRHEFERVFAEYSPDYVIIPNIFSVGEGIPVAPALTKTLDKFRLPTISINHDFTWENDRYAKPTHKIIEEYIREFFPPVRDYIHYFTINTIGQRALKQKKNIHADILYDTFDFDQPTWSRKGHITRFLNSYGIQKTDLIFLQATRVVRRKNIELSIDLVQEFKSILSKQTSHTLKLYDGRTFDLKKNNIHLILSGYVEMRDKPYLKQLMAHAMVQNVHMIYLGDHIDTKYRLWDIYPYADIITFPSEYEGFGNQILEGFFAKKPIAIFEYPVYKTDIKPKNFDVISLGDKLTKRGRSDLKHVPPEKNRQAARRVLEILTSPKDYTDTVSQNFERGEVFYSTFKDIQSAPNYHNTVSYNYDISSKHFSYQNAYEVLTSALI